MPAVLAATLAVIALAPAGRLTFVSGTVEHASAGGKHETPAEGAALVPGDWLRTGEGGLVRVEVGGMVLTLAGSSAVRIHAEPLRPVIEIEGGRVEVASEGETVWLATEEAQVRGGGRIVVRRAAGQTRLMALSGGFRVAARGGEVALASGSGTLVAAGRAPQAPRPLPAAPAVVSPGIDPRYVRVGEAVALTWTPPTPVHFQVLPFESPEAIVARDAESGPGRVSFEVPGLYRWRASVREADGWEGLPSTEGLISVVEDR